MPVGHLKANSLRKKMYLVSDFQYVSRMSFKNTLAIGLHFGAAGLPCLSEAEKPIDRYAVVSRHNVMLEQLDPLAPVSVGNGDFAFTADVTGMQTFGDYYYSHGIPLETLCTWAWHAFPNVNGYKWEETLQESDFHGRKIKYASLEKTPAAVYFRENPHPVPLGQIGFSGADGNLLDMNLIGAIHQQLDLWSGLIQSRYTYKGQAVYVETVAHPSQSMVSFKIKSGLLKSGALKPSIRFPYSYNFSQKNKPSFDWGKPDRHESLIKRVHPNSVMIYRQMDTSYYWVTIKWEGKASILNPSRHCFILDASGNDSITLTVSFSPDGKGNPERFDKIKTASASAWKEFWTKGGMADFGACRDPRAPELERRIILSQYLLKINYSGHFPPQETGLTHLSWYGKHNSEVYWIHAAQFYSWNHTDLLENGLSWYRKILDRAREEARSKGFEGAMWPKMAGYDGRPTPGGINPFIIWNQPNPIYLCELVYRANKDRKTLEKYKDVVFESARFLASYAFYDSASDRYVLGPPIKSVNESNDENATWNPGFELVQWYYGLKVAQDWRIRLGLPRDPHWDEVMAKLSRPKVVDGKYVQLETEPDMYERGGSLPSDIIMAFGYMPKTPLIDSAIMKRTFETIYARNGLSSFVSWSMGKGALTATRLGLRDIAVDIVCNHSPKASFSKSGYVPRPKEGLACPAYFPVNSSFLIATGLMLGGWDGCTEPTPGFLKNGDWQVRVESMQPMP
jgi:hypothetical protein